MTTPTAVTFLDTFADAASAAETRDSGSLEAQGASQEARETGSLEDKRALEPAKTWTHARPMTPGTQQQATRPHRA
ncbi:hypothetical protein E4U55_002913 [Claviceps digitariae]|nr:hypothetical protein E4U55_002913 [Claviceps digitariae]